MSLVRARQLPSLPTPTQPSTLYVIDTADVKAKRIYRTMDNNTVVDLGVKTGFMVNKKLLAAA